MAAAHWQRGGLTSIVILDLGLPDEDGFNVIPRMRQLYPGIGLLVLVWLVVEGRLDDIDQLHKLTETIDMQTRMLRQIPTWPWQSGTPRTVAATMP